MAKSNEIITGWRVYTRLLKVLAQPGALKAMIESRRLDPEKKDSFGKEVERAAEKWPDLPAIKFEDLTLTFSEVNEEANRYARALKELGARKGDSVSVIMTNRPETLLVLTGIYKLGAVAAVINTTLRGQGLAHCLGLTQPRLVVVGDEMIDAVDTVDDPRSICDTWAYVPDRGEASSPDGMLDLTGAAQRQSSENLPETDDVRLGDPAVYIFTSGTTGLPKAAVNDHRRLRYTGLLVGKLVVRSGPSDTLYSALPLYHVTALMGGWSGAVHTGSAMAVAREFHASTFWDDIRKYDATAFVYVGEMLRYLYNQPRRPDDRDHGVRLIYGAGLRHEIWTDFKERFGIDQVREVYGASESPSGFLNLMNFDKTAGWSPLGWKTVAFDVDAEHPVRGPDGLLQEVGKGEVGLLLFKIDDAQPFNGYTDSAATEKKILRDVFKPGDRWFDSGDLVLNQGHGHIRFIDRVGDTYRWNGENVATTSVERAINGWPQVEDCVVYGVKVPGTEGRCGMAWVTTRDDEDLDLEGLAKHLRSELPPYAVPRFLRTGGHADLTGTFRHKKGALKREGYDLAKVEGRVYVLTKDSNGYELLTPRLEEQVETGAVRL